MGTLKPDALLRNWKTKRFARVYLFAEQNYFEKEQYIASLVQILFPGGLSVFNHEAVSFPGSTVQDALNSALMLPFTDAKRFVHLKGIEYLNTQQQETLAKGVVNLPETTLMICETNKSQKETLRSVLGKTIAKAGDIIFFWKPGIYDLPRIVTKRVAGSGKTIAPEAARFIAEDSGDDQGQLMMEVDKLLLYCADKRVIGLKEAAEVCGQTATHNLFDLRDSLQARNTEKSMAILEHLLLNRIEPINILNFLYQMYRRLLLAKLMMEKKMNRENIVPLLGINTYYDKHFFSDLNHFGLDELIGCLSHIREADKEIKTGKAKAEGKLAVLVLKLSGSKQFVELH